MPLLKAENFLAAIPDRTAGNGGPSRLAGAAPVPGWLESTRMAARDTLGARGLPTPREEAWKYTNVAPLTRVRYSDGTRDTPDAAALERTRSVACSGVDADCEIVLVNGRYAASLSRGQRRDRSVVLGSLSSELPTSPETAPALWRGERAPRDGFEALNLAYFEDGARIRVSTAAAPPRDPLTIHVVHIGAGAVPVLAIPGNVIDLEEGAHAVVVESYLHADSQPHCLVGGTFVSLGPGSTLEHYILCSGNEAGSHLQFFDADLREQATYRCVQIGLGHQLSRTHLAVRLEEPGADCGLYGLSLARARQHRDFHTSVEHLVARCRSDESFKAIVTGHGRSVYNGMVRVHEGAEKTVSAQTSHNLLLSPDAEVDTKPELEIYADDVQCSHGATVGQLDAEMLFYLRSRGLEEDAARALLTAAFAEDVIERVPIPGLRATLGRGLGALLPDSEAALALGLIDESGHLAAPAPGRAETTRAAGETARPEEVF